jgi:hypothetical protein
MINRKSILVDIPDAMFFCSKMPAKPQGPYVPNSFFYAVDNISRSAKKKGKDEKMN